ncbi:MAG: CCA-adding enzyme [Pelotomaculum sp. PtaU1.Bin035]|nr:MAG: CCA-adding enzyme [Pelotomaculum sp. PtaU1.Bin035]
MKNITIHGNTDMDALAAMVAAQKPYPAAVMVFPGKLSRSVEEFMALYKDTLDVKEVRDIDPVLVDLVILVDTKSPGYLANLGEVNDILGVMGGGGHNAAASATIKKSHVEELAGQLMDAIRSNVRLPINAAAIMSSPVKTITPDTIIEEAGQVMLRYGHTGLPVVKDEQVLGIVSRRDVEKAAHHGLGQAPVNGFMTSNLVSVSPEVPAPVMRELMIEHDIGRLPVIKNGKLVGIVTRSDVLRTLHGSGLHSGYQAVKKGRAYQISSNNIQALMYRGLPVEFMEVLKRSGDLASGMGCKVYAAGGIVRDLFLGIECLDIDLVVEGNGIELAEAMSKEYHGRLRAHPKFGTAKILFPDGRQVDVTTARVEFYQHPAAMPQVEMSSLQQDLYRRDFSINAMAVSLNRGSFGDVVDFFGGREDLERGLIRVLHNLSFIEDPTRILRAVKFEKRYHMNLESQTQMLIKEAIRNNMLARVSVERVWEELKYIFREPRPAPALARIIDLQLWDFLFPGVESFKVKQVLSEFSRSVKALRFWDLVEPDEPWMVYFLAILHSADWTTASKICRRYSLNKRQMDKAAAALGGWRGLLGKLQEPGDITLSELARQVMSVPKEVYPLILSYLIDNASMRRFRQVLTVICYNKPSINGKDLRIMGYKPGPVFKRVLDAVWQARLDGMIRTRQEELSYAKEYLSGYEGAIRSV